MLDRISAKELREKKEQGVDGITEGNIYVQKLREASEKQNLEEFCNICKEVHIQPIETRNYVLARVSAVLLNNYFNVALTQNEYCSFTKKVDYWENKASELKDLIARQQWNQFQNLVERIIFENKKKKINVLDFYEWLDKKGYYHYVEQYEQEQNPNGILGENGYDAFRDWLEANGFGNIIYDYEQSKK